jgi:hypothetical protein
MTKAPGVNGNGSVPPEHVLASLERVLASGEFTDSAQLSRFLRYIVENALGGEPGRLKESVIGLDVFRRGSEYDPKSNPIVRVEARRLRARLDAYYEAAGAADAVKIVLPKGGYAPIFEAITPAVEPPPPEPQSPPPSAAESPRKPPRPGGTRASCSLRAWRRLSGSPVFSRYAAPRPRSSRDFGRLYSIVLVPPWLSPRTPAL